MNYEQIKKQLEQNLLFRERKNKNYFIAKILKEKYKDLENNLEDIIVEANSADRYWRMVLQENPLLRGTDYETKRKITEEKKISLGYESNYHRDIKQLRMI